MPGAAPVGSVVPANELRGNPRVADSFVVGHLRQYEDIVDAIARKRPPLVRVKEALLALTVVRALYLSATLGRTVTIAEVQDASLDDIEVRTGSST